MRSLLATVGLLLAAQQDPLRELRGIWKSIRIELRESERLRAEAHRALDRGDHATAWASKLPDGGEEWIELSFRQPVRPTAVRVRETYNPGAIVRIEAKAAEGAWRVLWEGEDGGRECPRWWSPRVVRLTLASHKVPGWNEIDAVELVGEPPEVER
jgi:hypothetical protein